MDGLNPLFNLSGRTALITGSSQGIGFALARGLAQAGAAIVLNGRDKLKLARAAAELPGEGSKVRTSAFDVTDGTTVLGEVEQVPSQFAFTAI
jgi:gluconate 5-dehydrogenase